MPAKKPFTFPKSLGGCADRIYALRQQRLAAQKVVETIETEEKALKEHIINTLPKSEARGVSGKVANVKVVTKDVPQVEDWEAFYAFVRKSKRTDLLQRRPAEGAINEILNSGKTVPGVKISKAVSLSITKA